MENKIKNRIGLQHISDLATINKTNYSVQESIKSDKITYEKLRKMELIRLKNDMKLKTI